VQKTDPCWVPPLLIDQKSFFDKKHPFYEHGEVCSWLARSTQGGEILGRVSAIVNHRHNEFHEDKTGFFGFFECVNDSDVAQLLLIECAHFLRQRRMTAMRGPMSFSTNEECGMLYEGFDTPPTIMMPHNPPYYNRLMEECGLGKAMDLLSYEMPAGGISDRIIRVGQKLESRLKIKIRPFNKKDFWGEVALLKSVYDKAWTKNWGFVPMTEHEIHHLAQNLKLIYDPRLLYFAEAADGTTVGFCLALPDINQVLIRMNGRLLPTGILTLLAGRRKINRVRVLLMGVIESYRVRGIDTVFYYRIHRDGVSAGYKWAEFSWILENNKMMNDAAIGMGGTLYKRHRVWEKHL
jgi:hypothetical protein